MRTEIYVCSIVFPNVETVFLYEADSKTKSFYSNIVDSTVSDEMIERAKDSIKTAIKADSVSLMTYSKTMMLTLDSIDDLRKRNVNNLYELIESSNQYEPMTQLKDVKNQLASLRNTVFSDMCISENMRLDGDLSLQMYVIVIYAPSDWNQDKPSVSQKDVQAADQVSKMRQSMPDAYSSRKTDELISDSGSNGVGQVRNGTIQKISELSRIVNPYERTLLTMIQTSMRQRISSNVTNVYEILRYTPLNALDETIRKDNKNNVSQIVIFENNKAEVNISSANVITNSEYISNFKADKSINYESSSFKVTNPDAWLIYAPPGSGKTYFMAQNALVNCFLDTDYSAEQYNADFVITNRHELINKYKNSISILYEKNEWYKLVAKKIPDASSHVEWYDEMESNVKKSTYVINASRNGYVSDYIRIQTVGNNQTSSVVMKVRPKETPPQIEDESTHKLTQNESKELDEIAGGRKLSSKQSKVLDNLEAGGADISDSILGESKTKALKSRQPHKPRK